MPVTPLRQRAEAPAQAGYLTINAQDVILEANLRVAALLGQARPALAGQPLPRFIRPADQKIYDLHRKRLLATGEPQTCELRLAPRGADGAIAEVEQHLQSILASSPDTIYTIDLSTEKTTFLNRAEFCGFSRRRQRLRFHLARGIT